MGIRKGVDRPSEWVHKFTESQKIQSDRFLIPPPWTSEICSYYRRIPVFGLEGFF